MNTTTHLSTPPEWRLRLLGSVVMDGPDRGATRAVLSQPKRFAVLLYLMLNEGYVRRDQLLATFWPRSNATNARGSLRQTLSFLRKSLDNDIILRQGNDEVALAPSRIWCDVRQFEAEVSAGRVEGALEHYRGDLLEGFFVQGARGFQDWLERERARLRQRASDAAWVLAERSEHVGRAAEAAFWGKRALSLSRFNEPGVRRLVRMLDRVGDREGALRAYAGLERHLSREFGVPPSPETRRLIEQVKAREDVAGSGLISPADPRTVADRRASERRLRAARLDADEERRRDERRKARAHRRSGRDRRGSY